MRYKAHILRYKSSLTVKLVGRMHQHHPALQHHRHYHGSEPGYELCRSFPISYRLLVAGQLKSRSGAGPTVDWHILTDKGYCKCRIEIYYKVPDLDIICLDII